MNFMKPHKISTQADNWQWKLSEYVEWVRILRGLRNSFSNRCWKFQLAILKKKVSFLKKCDLSPTFKISHKKSYLTRVEVWISELLRNFYLDFFFNVQSETANWARDSYLKINRYYIIFGNLKFSTNHIAFLMRYFKH